jgi:hypothetical protein
MGRDGPGVLGRAAVPGRKSAEPTGGPPNRPAAKGVTGGGVRQTGPAAGAVLDDVKAILAWAEDGKRQEKGAPLMGRPRLVCGVS